MIVSKKGLEKIRKIIENNYRSLLVNIAGNSVLNGDELDSLNRAGYDTKNENSLLSLIYFNNVLNDLTGTSGPVDIDGMIAQQAAKPTGGAHDAAVEHLNENFAQVVEKIKANVQAGIEGVTREYNLRYRNNAVQNLDRPTEVDKIVMQSSVGGLKQNLRDYYQDGNRDWQRVAVTETANALGMGSVDRVVMQNKDKDLEEVLVYRISIKDAALCKYCRKFYLDEDDTPAVYRLSELLNNGTNYGKRSADWKPVVGATHPNERCSGILELRSGWRVSDGGKLEFIGPDAWHEYIKEKIRD